MCVSRAGPDQFVKLMIVVPGANDSACAMLPSGTKIDTRANVKDNNVARMTNPLGTLSIISFKMQAMSIVTLTPGCSYNCDRPNRALNYT